MNLYHPDKYKDEQGNIMNSFLRAPSKDNGPRLTGDLFAGFASMWKVEASIPASMLNDEVGLDFYNIEDL